MCVCVREIFARYKQCHGHVCGLFFLCFFLNQFEFSSPFFVFITTLSRTEYIIGVFFICLLVMLLFFFFVLLFACFVDLLWGFFLLLILIFDLKFVPFMRVEIVVNFRLNETVNCVHTRRQCEK